MEEVVVGQLAAEEQGNFDRFVFIFFIELIQLLGVIAEPVLVELELAAVQLVAPPVAELAVLAELVVGPGLVVLALAGLAWI